MSIKLNNIEMIEMKVSSIKYKFKLVINSKGNEEKSKELRDNFYKLHLIDHYNIGLNLIKQYWGEDQIKFNPSIDYFLNLFKTRKLEIKRECKKSTNDTELIFLLKTLNLSLIPEFVNKIKEYFDIDDTYINYLILKDIEKNSVIHYPEDLKYRSLKDFLIDYKILYLDKFISVSKYDTYEILKTLNPILYKSYYEDNKDYISTLEEKSKDNPKLQKILQELYLGNIKVNFNKKQPIKTVENFFNFKGQ